MTSNKHDMTSKDINPFRRSFLKGSGYVSLAFLVGGTFSVLSDAGAQAENTLPNNEVNAWVDIFEDGVVNIKYAAAEMGQGINTALTMIIADEMEADWSKVTVEQISVDPNKIYGNPEFGGNLYAAGSASVEAYYPILRLAGAQVRVILTHVASSIWGVPSSEVSINQGVISHNGSDKKMPYGDVVKHQHLIASAPIATASDIKNKDQLRLVGTNVQRKDMPDKVSGKAVYSIDIELPGMLYAAQALSPVEGDTPESVDSSAAKKIKGVKHVIILPNSVNVLADSWHTAKTARDQLVIAWSENSSFRTADSQSDLKDLEGTANNIAEAGVTWRTKGELDNNFADSETVYNASYTTEHVYHAQMEPLNAVATVDKDGKGAEVWIGTQGQSVSLGVAVGVLGTTPDRIKLNAMTMGGAFGRRTVFAREHLRDTLLLSKQTGTPVKLIWSREDDVKHGWYRPANCHRLDATLNDKGRIVALRHRVASPSIVEFASPFLWDTTKRIDPLIMEGTECDDYDIPHFDAEHIVMPRKTKLSAWRGIGWGPNCFARECFMDVLAKSAGIDPFSFRIAHLHQSERGLNVLKAVALMSNFGKPPAGRYHGISFAGYKKTYGAGVAEISIDAKSGKVTVHKFWAVADPGIVIHPNAYIAQVEGGVNFGLSSLFGERITVKDGKTQQNNYYDYRIMRNNEAPDIEVQLIESGAAPSGGGEIGVPMTGAAVANAIFAATGEQPTNIPFGPQMS